MSLIVPNAGEKRLLEYIVNKTAPTNMILHLYTNVVDLSTQTFTAAGDQAGQAGSFTEANAAGYAAVTLSGANWTASTTAGVSSAIYNTSVSFGFTAGQNIQGYYVTDSLNRILWAEEFPGAPFSLPTTGGEISIRPQVQLN
jgi:hypothetical protein